MTSVQASGGGSKRKQVKAYFEDPSTYHWWVMGIGVFLAFIGGVGSTEEMVVIGLIVIGLGIFLYYQMVQGKPSDTQMDRWLEEDLENLRRRALNKLGVDESELVRDPVEVTGFGSAPGAVSRYKVGNDGKTRCNPVAVSVLHFGEDQLLSYECAYDRIEDQIYNEGTDEYFYKDVVSVSTKTEEQTFTFRNQDGQEERRKLNAAETFMLHTSGGTSVRIIIDAPELLDEKERRSANAAAATSDAEQTVKAVRTMLREKKE